MRRILIAILATSFTVAGLVPAVTGAAGRRPAPAKCPSGQWRPLLADSQAQIYEAPTNPSLPEVRSFIGCSYAHGKSYVLGEPPSSTADTGFHGTRRYTLAGPIVAFEKFLSGNPQVAPVKQHGIIVRDLRNGRVLQRLPTGTPTTPAEPGDYGIGAATAIVLKSDGAVAWIVATANGKGGEFQVHAVDKSGSRVLAAGADVSQTSLALAGSTLYWTQGGKPYSAALN
jgi:hypothetical protein